MTQIEQARKGNITEEMEIVAKQEQMPLDLLQTRIAKGEVIIPKNKNHQLDKIVGVGQGLKVKVNANIGTSTDTADVDFEIKKATAAVEAGADAIMDLSTGGNLIQVRKAIMDSVSVVIGTVPIYQIVVDTVQKDQALTKMDPEYIFEVLEQQAEEGVDFFTIHCGLTMKSLERLKKQGRITDIVSRGGSFLTTWMIANNQENPFYEHFDRVCDIAQKHDVTLSLGDGLRPGSLADATDRAQIEELLTLGELTEEAWKHNVQVMVEGPGHVPLNEIRTNMELQKSVCANAPFYVLGPLVTDIAPGYDHITSAIGGALAAWAGADFLCYVTPSEHLKLPDINEVREGVIASRIAAHAADIAKGIPGAKEWDLQMSQARKKLDWEKQFELCIDPVKAKALRNQGLPQEDAVCSMCGEFCAIKMVNESLGTK